MDIIHVDTDKLETYLAERFGDRLRTGRPQKNPASCYFWDKREKFLHANMKRQGLTANTGGR